MWIAAVIFVFSIAVAVWLIKGGSGPDPDDRYCWKCRKNAQWHARRGCESCAFHERAW